MNNFCDACEPLSDPHGIDTHRRCSDCQGRYVRDIARYRRSGYCESCSRTAARVIRGYEPNHAPCSDDLPRALNSRALKVWPKSMGLAI